MDSPVYYAGIGSRKTPEPKLKWMRIYGSVLADLGLTLRSGAAPGGDTAWEEGCDRQEGKKEIFLPWKNFQKHPSTMTEIPEIAFEVGADIYGSAWQYLKRPVKMLMARDIQQVGGTHLDSPVAFVACWTPDGCESRSERTRKTGGTGQAIAYASELGIPVFNFCNGEKEFLSYLKETFGDKTSKVPKG